MRTESWGRQLAQHGALHATGPGEGMPALAPQSASHYRDEGCSIAPHCLDCPLPRCRHDLQAKVAGALLREAQVHALLAAGLTADQCAAAMGMSRRSVFRLKRQLATASILPLLTERTRP